MDVLHLDEGQMENILGTVLYEFPLRSVHVQVPDWLQALDLEHPLVQSMLGQLRDKGRDLRHVRDYRQLLSAFDMEESDGLSLEGIQLGKGAVEMSLGLPQKLFYQVLGNSAAPRCAPTPI